VNDRGGEQPRIFPFPVTVDQFGGNGRASGITHLITGTLAFTATCLSGACLWILTEMKTDIRDTRAAQGRQQEAISTLAQQALDTARRVDIAVTINARQDDQLNQDKVALANHEVRIGNDTERIGNLEHRR
jgi:hypothetical protein